MEDGDGGQVGGTGGEGFVVTSSWMHLEDGANDKDVRHENNEGWADGIKSGKNEMQQMIEKGVSAREEEQWEFTEVIDCVGNPEW